MYTTLLALSVTKRWIRRQSFMNVILNQFARNAMKSTQQNCADDWEKRMKPLPRKQLFDFWRKNCILLPLKNWRQRTHYLLWRKIIHLFLLSLFHQLWLNNLWSIWINIAIRFGLVGKALIFIGRLLHCLY